MLKKTYILSVLAINGALALSGCGGADRSVPPATLGAEKSLGSPPPAATISVDFNTGIDGWISGVADYTDGSKPTEVASSWEDLPAPLSGKGYYLTSHNNSDDLMTYVKRQVGGFVPGAKYGVSFAMRFASDAASGCAGVGGSRGDSIYMVVAASGTEPETVKQSDGNYRLNLDRGNQARSGRQGKVLGVQGSAGLSCDGGTWVSSVRTSSEAIELQADKDGKFWIVLGTDSGFEAANALYLQGAEIAVKPL
ncbi:hypothetical protein [Janthinobacterium agaricidamnosum]|uniref:Putative lipoprotein n=1 Tax=Janthinobacterium agaricidamnosum NBRC 102515 = DSM 9628 TaxID=1349767 RepID=W0V164_9BURK|nr:hypothetical protein [Janthinobacterium agaricidamnosum]CDG81073.1 putative lipoprotein [Janthinobacterium agaricidamnosum NBRC 102515 = DSM 9628]